MISVSFAQCGKEEESTSRQDYSNGDYYIGEFNEAGKRHGQGVYYWNNGNKYDGQWENNYRNGQGTYTWVSGAKYVGNWENDYRNGQGKMTYDYGHIYEGTWKDGKRNGQGTHTSKDGSTFTCEWKDDEPVDEKCYLLWHLKTWYFWKDEIGKIDAKDYASAEDLLAKKKYAQDNLSNIENKATGSNSLFFDGKELGYGFGMRRDMDNNLRVSYVHSNSPGGINGLKRGWKITHIDGGDVAAMSTIPSNTVDREGLTRSFTVEDENGASKAIFLTSSIYNVQTVMHNNVIQHNRKAVGYLAIKSFISQSPDALLSAASSLANSGISELALDLRYCSGGSYSVLNDFVGIVAPGYLNSQTYLKANYNSDYTDSDTAYIIRKTGSLNLSRIFVITSNSTTNMPEHFINGLSPYMSIIKVGDKTGGNVYGQSSWTFGEKRYSLVTYKLTNAQNESPVNGISPDYYVADGVSTPWGDENEYCLNAILFYIDNGYFPTNMRSIPPLLKSSAGQEAQIIEPASPAEALPILKETVNTVREKE
jgi:C-terminal processing protease CtpA/Prc